MVSIGNSNQGLQEQMFRLNGQQKTQSFGGNNYEYPKTEQSAAAGSSFQQRLEAIDKGQPVAFTSSVGAAQGASFSPQATSSSTLMSRLDAIGTGELSPKYGEAEKGLNLFG